MVATDCELLDSYAVGNRDGYLSLRSEYPCSGGDLTYCGTGQIFTSRASRKRLCSVMFYLKRLGNPNANLQAQLYEITGTIGVNATPTGSALVSSSKVAMSSISNSEYVLVEFSFPTTYVMEASHNYAIILITTDVVALDASNYVFFGTDGSTPTHGGNIVYYFGGWIANANIDAVFYIYDGHTYGGGPYVSIGTLATYDPDNDGIKDTIGPLNLPYGRVSDNLREIIEKTYTSVFVPWEWWFNYSGQLNIAERRGAIKAISFVAGNQIGGSIKEESSKQTGQRIRVIGRGESAEQDEVTSQDDDLKSWHEDCDAMDIINSFYEKIISKKTISSKLEADTWARIVLTQEAPTKKEITVILTNDPYTANDFDVGDTVTVTDPDTGLSGLYRIKTIEKTVNNASGETTILTCTERRTDITDRLSNIYKTLQELLMSSTFFDKMYGEGGKQRKVKAEEIEDVWEQTSSNKWFTELPEDGESADPAEEITECDKSGTGVSYACTKDDFSVICHANSMGYIILDKPRLKFSRDPRFTCEFEIDATEGDAWANGDYAYIRIYQVNDTNGICSAPYGDAGFGFRILKTSGVYELRTYLHDGGVTTVEIKVANLILDTKYIIEARMEWKEKIIKYYFGKADVPEDDPEWGFKLRAIAPVNLAALDEANLTPFHVTIDSRHAPSTQELILPIYRWRTQAIRAVKP